MKSALDLCWKHGCITATQFSEEMAKLEATLLPQTVADEVLLRLSASRAALTAEINKVRSEIAERVGIFLCALNALAVPPTSILRDVLDSDTAKQPESKEEPQKRTKAVKNTTFILAIGRWWEKPAIRKLVETVKSPDGPGGKITTWSDLIKFVCTGNGKHAELRRALSKRFSEIYNKHYLPLVKNKK